MTSLVSKVDSLATRVAEEINAVREELGAPVVVSATAPADPVVGMSWFDTTSGLLFVFYDGFWVEPSAVPPGSGDPSFFVQATPPAVSGPYVWWDTSVSGRPTLWIEDGA